MSDQWGGPGWWYASDGKWYPPHGESASAFDLEDDRILESVSSGLSSAPQNVVFSTEGPSASARATSAATDVEDLDFEGADLDEIDLDEIDLDALERDSQLVPPLPPPVSPELSPPEPSGSAAADTSSRSALIDLDRPASVTRTTVGPAVRPSSPDDDLAGPPSEGLPGTDDPIFGGQSRRRESALFAAAVLLAALTGVLGALWLRERSAVDELRSEVEVTRQLGGPDETVEALERENNTLRIQNAQLEQQLADMGALVLELPAGRVTEIDVPLEPVFADEENGRLIAVDAEGAYVVFGDGAENPITDSGQIGSAPTGLFAATAKAWVSTEDAQIEILPLVVGAETQETVSFGPVEFLAPDERGYWTYDAELEQIVRLRKSDGGLTDAVNVPVGVVDLTIGAGSVWALGDDGLVYRINTADLTVQPIEVGDDLVSITAAPDALWTLSAGDGSLRRIDPVTGSVLVTVPVGRDPIDAIFAGSSVWVALRSGSSLIEVDTLTSAVVSRTELSDEPTALYEGDSGVYVTTSGEGAPLFRIDSLVTAPDPVQEVEDIETSDDS